MKRYLLRVDLSSGKIRREEIPQKVLHEYVGGKGLAAYYCFKEIPPGVEPFAPQNKLMFFIGPLTGIFNVYSRHVIATRSPQTGTFTDSYAGGWFAPELARAGLMGLIFEGQAKRLSYLKIDGEKATLEDAAALAGKDCYAVDEMFPDYRVATIGPAGEKLVRFACVVNDCTRRQRAGVAGRGGIGAVMGSKRLKAVLVKGHLKAEDIVPAEHRETALALRREMVEYLKKEVVPGFGLGGNLPVMQVTSDSKITPTLNFRRGTLPGIEKVTEKGFAEVTVGKKTCFLCPVGCGVAIRAKEGPYAGVELERIEYETVAMNGPNCGHTDIGAITKVARLCNEYGMDTIAVGSLTAFVMELSEKGLIDYKLDYGDTAGQVKLVEMIGRREGLGDLLAEGVKAAAKKLGMDKHAVHVKGLEIPGYDVRGPVGMALAYATADRGGDHLRAWTIVAEASSAFSIEGKAKLTKDLQDRNAALWCLIGCDNIPGNTTTDPGKFTDFSIRGLNALGIPMDAEAFIRMGERVYNLTRQFNVREGFARKDDNMPPRFEEPRDDTGWKVERADFERMLDEYYALRGWDKDGRPAPATLKRLGLSA